MPIFMNPSVEINCKQFGVGNFQVLRLRVRAEPLTVPAKFRIIALAEVVVELD